MAHRYLGEHFQEGAPQGEGCRRRSRGPASLQRSKREGVPWGQLSRPMLRMLFSPGPELPWCQEETAVIVRAEVEPSEEAAAGPQDQAAGGGEVGLDFGYL